MADQSAYSSDENSSAESEQGGDKKLLEDALARFKLVEEAEHEIRKDALDDLRFAAGDQWDEAVKQARQLKRRPCLTINRLPQQIRQVTNDQRQNRPSIKVHPVDDKADRETADIYSGLIRHIEYNSNADVAYDTAFEGAVRAGRGYLRVITDYVSPMSFDQEILIKRIRNPFSVFFDPYSKEPDGSDACFAFITEDLSKTEYEAQFPGSKLASIGDWSSVGNAPPNWMSGESARVVEYFYKDTREEELVLLSTGETVLARDLDQVLQARVAEGVVAGEVRRRKTRVPFIHWCKLNALEVLEKTEWLGSFIPIIPVYGEELDIDGKRILKGIVRDAKDPQRMLNIWKSAETEAIALAPKAPWLVEETQIEGFEHDWKTANIENHAYLKYKAKDIKGTPIPPPQRLVVEPAVQVITQAAMLAADDIKATTGIYDSALGARSNETSGKAILARTNQAQTSNFHFVDNLTRSIRHTGRIIIELLPKIYDTARAARILGEDGEPEVIRLNQEFERKGKVVTYDLSKGKYDCTVHVGPSYASKRQEAAASMLEVTKAVPQILQIAGDLLVKNMDWPGAQEIADRLKKALPPGLAEDPNSQGQDVPPQVKAQMQQMGQMVEQLTAKLNELQAEREQKLIEIESKERIEMKKLEVELEIERAKLDAKDSLALLNAEIAQINQRLSLLRAQEPISDDFAPPVDGALGAQVDGGGQDPIGGESPSFNPVEISHDDPNAI